MKRVALAFVLAGCSQATGPELDAQQIHRPQGSAAMHDAGIDGGVPTDAASPRDAAPPADAMPDAR